MQELSTLCSAKKFGGISIRKCFWHERWERARGIAVAATPLADARVVVTSGMGMVFITRRRGEGKEMGEETGIRVLWMKGVQCWGRSK